MLAQNFRTPEELEITDAEHLALIKVLGMLERGELRNAHYNDEGDFLFNMACQGDGCGTPACIGGWVAFFLETDQIPYVDSYMYGGSLHQLYWKRTISSTTTEEAAIALRSYLTTGDARWDLAVPTGIGT